MRFDQVRGVLVALAALTPGCNEVLGVEDVGLLSDAGTPTSDPARCLVASRFPAVSSGTAPGASLVHLQSGTPSLLILLNADPRFDGLFLRLYNNMGGHGVVNAPGAYSLSEGDARPETCALCISVEADFDSGTSTFGASYAALGQGEVEFTVANETGLAGSMRGLKLRHVDVSSGTREVDDGCSVTIDRVDFDLTYSAAVAR